MSRFVSEEYGLYAIRLAGVAAGLQSQMTQENQPRCNHILISHLQSWAKNKKLELACVTNDDVLE